MADFKIAINKILMSEGGYVDDPSDSGGETYKGISRINWPTWAGWRSVDALKDEPTFPKNLKKDTYLQDSVLNFYRTNFWNKVGGDFMDSQSIADLLIDSAINEGITPAIKRAQGIVGLPQTGKVTDELVQKLNMLK